MMTLMTCPRPLNHIGISVPDIDRAIAWYGEVLGYRLFSGPFDLVANPPVVAQFQDALGERCKHVRIAHLSTGGGVGIELFQPVLPATLANTTDIRFDQSGPFHICVTDPDIDGLINKIVATGGSQISQIWDDRPPSGIYRMAYCRDPFGTIIEIHTHSYEIVQGWRVMESKGGIESSNTPDFEMEDMKSSL